VIFVNDTPNKKHGESGTPPRKCGVESEVCLVEPRGRNCNIW
jgi:hypothetical protein